MTSLRRHQQGLRVLSHVLQEKSWDILLSNKIQDEDFFADSKICLKFIRDFVSKYKDFPSKEIVSKDAKISFPEDTPKQYSIEKFNDFKLSKRLQNLFLKAGDLAVKDPQACLDFIRKDIGEVKHSGSTLSFKQDNTGRFDRYIKGLTETLNGVEPAWPTMRAAFGLYENATINMILGLTSSGKCLEENELCTVYDGTRRTIKEVVEKKMKVLSINHETGEFKCVRPVDWINSGKKECFEVEFRTGDTITASKDHPILTNTGWVKIEDLEEGKPIARVGKIPQPKNYYKLGNRDELTVLAALLADGSITEDSKAHYTKKDMGLIHYVNAACKRLGIAFYQSPGMQKGDAYRWHLSAPETWKVLKKYDVKPCHGNNKILPEWFFKLPNSDLQHFINVFWSHDGTYSISREGTPVLEVKQANKPFIDQIRHIMLRLGVFTKYRHEIFDGKHKHTLIVLAQEYDKFFRKFKSYRKIQLKPEYKGRRYTSRKRVGKSPLIDCKNVFWDSVKSITPVGIKNTYDVSVEGTHSFEAGYTHIHNSWASCVTAKHAAFEQSRNTLLVSLENPKDSMDDRMEALYHKIPFGDIKKGMVDFRLEKIWRERLKELTNEEGDITIVDAVDVKKVSDIQRQIDLVEPDFVIVDGAYKLASSRGKSGYEKSSETLQALEDLAKDYNIPLLGTSQLNKTAQKAVGGRDTAFEARGNQEMLMNPSSVCCLMQSEDDILLNRVRCIIAKCREGSDPSGNKEFYLKQDRVNMDFSEITEEYYDEEGIKGLL